MGITNETIFAKMTEEIKAAKSEGANVSYHISRVKLLCELILENDSVAVKNLHDELNHSYDVKETEHNSGTKEMETVSDSDPYSIFDF